MNDEKCGCVCHTVGLFGLNCCECTRKALDEFVNGRPVMASPEPPPAEPPCTCQAPGLFWDADCPRDGKAVLEAGSCPSAPASSSEPLPKLKAGHMGNEIDISDWPNCAVPGCRNKSCLALKSAKCHPHTLLERMESGPVDLQDAAQFGNNPWKHIPEQYQKERWGVDYDEKLSTFFVHSGGYRIADAEDSEVAHAICTAFNGHMREGK